MIVSIAGNLQNNHFACVMVGPGFLGLIFLGKGIAYMDFITTFAKDNLEYFKIKKNRNLLILVSYDES